MFTIWFYVNLNDVHQFSVLSIFFDLFVFVWVMWSWCHKRRSHSWNLAADLPAVMIVKGSADSVYSANHRCTSVVKVQTHSQHTAGWTCHKAAITKPDHLEGRYDWSVLLSFEITRLSIRLYQDHLSQSWKQHFLPNNCRDTKFWQKWLLSFNSSHSDTNWIGRFECFISSETSPVTIQR